MTIPFTTPPDRRVLATGRARARMTAGDEGGALAALASLEAAAGSLPWAFVLEPATPDDPWEVRADLPEPERALGVEGVVFEPWESPGLVEAADRGWLLEERAEWDGVVVRRWWRGEEVRRPDLHRPGATDPQLRRLEGLLAAAVAPFPLLAEPGSDAVAAVVHRASGATGLEVWVGGDPLPERARVLAAAADVVRTEPLLLPWVEFDEALGNLLLRLWLAAPPGEGLPGDDGADLTRDPGWWADRVASASDVEVQVVPAGPELHDAVVAAVTPIASVVGLVGGPARWRPGFRFAPTWVGELPAPDVLAALRALPGVAEVRIAPGVPYGLETEWPVLEPAVRVVGGVTWQRWRDPVEDRDRREVVEDREADARDVAAAAAVAAEVRPVVDSTGRRGLEVRGGRDTLRAEGLDALLADAAAMSDPALARLGTFAFERRGAVARRWWRDGVDPGPRRWEVAR